MVLVLDTSGSMSEDQKIQNAREGAKQLVNLLSPGDRLSLVPFNTKTNWASTDVPISSGRRQPTAFDRLVVRRAVELRCTIPLTPLMSIFCRIKSQNGNRILSVVVLTDGADTESDLKLDDSDAAYPVRWGDREPFTFSRLPTGRMRARTYLKEISDATQAKSYEGTPQNIVGSVPGHFNILLAAP